MATTKLQVLDRLEAIAIEMRDHKSAIGSFQARLGEHQKALAKLEEERSALRHRIAAGNLTPMAPATDAPNGKDESRVPGQALLDTVVLIRGSNTAVNASWLAQKAAISREAAGVRLRRAKEFGLLVSNGKGYFRPAPEASSRETHLPSG